ncbi:DNA-binding domain-containing protein, AraC-type [Acidovorax sp. CF316]|uniref:AraC family transcriptional regulator n=1 Tax=Acidovorax sp. CF316 TaxID=1144317 RepID=UPI00026BD77D|nr:AraC family transcriptional regulator [Acidovorax sp. CF316]EJE52545.1 DNA-binding domain-containing protein, AraC-type [Acidovorax sp. CF316]
MAPKKTGRTRTDANTDIERFDYRPPGTYGLDLEVFPMSDLRQRGPEGEVLRTHRYAFHMLVLVTRGSCTQVIDFEPVPCAPGSLLAIRPGQAHHFGTAQDWEGWVMLLRPEFLLAAGAAAASDLRLVVGLERFPVHLALGDGEARTVADAMVLMRTDAAATAPAQELHALLRYQLYALLARLAIAHGQRGQREPANHRALLRFERFRQLLEQRFAQWHQVADYAGPLGCTQKSLARATSAAAGMSAKAFIAARLCLEAKRLLLHTGVPVARIAERLGFDEATHFSKFFRREAGCTPAEFRRQQVAALPEVNAG